MENGNIFIVGRTKELIIRFGFKVCPVEVESVPNGLAGVARWLAGRIKLPASRTSWHFFSGA